MAFTQEQAKKLRAKLSPKHVRMREAEGRKLAYIEGWHAIAEANRIFGFDGWDRETVAEDCVWSARNAQHYACAYVVRVRITVRAGDGETRREGSGSGEAKAATPGQAHEMALKAAETDATKRALATFGNPFGLALYDKDHVGVRGGKLPASDCDGTNAALSRWCLTSGTGNTLGPYASASQCAQALRCLMREAGDVGQLFDIWSRNLAFIMQLQTDAELAENKARADALIALLKDRARELIAAAENGDANASQMRNGVTTPEEGQETQGKVDKSRLALPEPRRIRSKAHLAYVARLSCVICGRKPAQAHHVRFAQPSAMARKVSDEFAVPLCSTHHDEVHASGDERAWWQTQGTDPLAIAADLWGVKRLGRCLNGPLDCPDSS
jgi:DNA recombination protein Rad52